MAALVLVASGCGSSSKSPSASGSSTTASTTSGNSSTASGAPIKVAYLGNQTGTLAATFGAGVIGAQTFVKYYNSHGGLYGHQLDLSVYDDQSNPSEDLSNAKLAVDQGAQAIISSDVYFGSAVPYVEQQDIPVFGPCIVPQCYGPNTSMFFSQEGNWIGYEADVQVKYLVAHGDTKIAVISDANPGNAVAAHAISKAVSVVGGTLVYTNYDVDDTSSAALLAVAQRLKSAGAQGVYTNVYGVAPAELQADMGQVGSRAPVITGELGIDPAITSQFKSSVNGLLSEVFWATWLTPQVPAIQTFTAAMTQYSPANVQNYQALEGWSEMEMFAGAVQALGSNAPTAKNLITAGNTLTNFTGDGMFPPVSFPADHTQLNPCFTLAQVVGDQWTVVTGTASDPFACGQAVSSS
jgi:branched-chain amino acid transport system substrate-binding protein